MKKSVVIILSVLLAIALIVLVLLYHRYADKKAAFLTYEEQLSELDQKIIKMTRENIDLRGQILADAEKLKKLEQARHRISALENATETLSDRAASSNHIIAELQTRIKNFQIFISERNELIQKKDDEIKLLRGRVSDIENEKDAADKLINQLKSDHEIAALELNQKIKTRDKKEAEHLKQLEAANAEIQHIRQKVTANQEKIAGLGSQLSDSKGKKDAADKLIDQLKSDHEIAVLELNQKIKTRHKKEAEHLKQLEAANTEIQHIRQKVTANQEKIAGLSNQLSDCKGKKNAADKLINQLKSDHEIAALELNQKIKTRHKKETEHLKQLEAANTEIQHIRQKVTANQKKIAGLSSQLSDCKGKKNAADLLIDQFKSDHGIAVAALNQKIAEKNRGITALEKQLEKSRAETIAFTDEAKAHEGRIKYLEQRISTLFGEKELLKSRMNQLKSSYTSMASDLKNQILKKEVTIDELEGKLRITFVNRILFEFGKAAISSQGEDILTKVGKNLKELRDKKIRVIGHTDSIPIMEEYRYKFPSNWELSAARSAAVVRFLQTKIGINPRNLEAVGRSLYDPIAPNTTKKGRAKNRRVNIIVAPLIE